MDEIKVWATADGRGITNNKKQAEAMGWLPMVPLTDLERAEAELKKIRDLELDVRGKLAAQLKCWHRLTGVEAEELVALYTAPVTQHGWLPIESAPKDMASRLYRVNGFCVQGFIDATGVLCAQNDAVPWRKMKGKPTHWVPLPTAPEAP